MVPTITLNEKETHFPELLCRSYYSFLEGASSPEALVYRAAELQIPALALVDRNGLYGVQEFVRACREVQIKPIIRAQLTLQEKDEVIVLCRNNMGYKQLCHLITEAHRGRTKGDPVLRYSSLKVPQSALFFIIGGKEGQLTQYLRQGDWQSARGLIKEYLRWVAKEDLYIALVNHHEAGDDILCQRLHNLAKEMGLSTLASNGVRYARTEEGYLYDVLLCIKNHVTLNTSHHSRSGNRERFLKPLGKLLSNYPEALQNTQKMAGQCHVELDQSSYRIPDFPVPEGHTHDTYLAQICEERLVGKGKTIKQKVEHELQLIQQLQLSGYFLVVWDIVEFARRRGIPVQGRGSAANSVVAYLLGITPVDPIAHNLFLGRFIHEGMSDAPDIDLDFAASRQEGIPDREEIIQYVYQKYGEDHVAMVCTYITFQGRSAIREVGKVLELPEKELERLAKMVGYYGSVNVLEEITKTEELGLDFSKPEWQVFKQLFLQIANIPRHISTHVGGMIIASRPIAELVPLEPACMEGRVVCQWDKDMIADAGLIKVDILGLGMLAVMREAQEHAECDLDTLSFDDPAVYDCICAADTVGVFQVESRAQMQSLHRTRPRNFSELGVQVAIIRPGPLQGNMVAPYIRRKQGDEAVSYPHPSLKPILGETLGVILFQEQVLQTAVIMAGFSSLQAADLRRAMSRKRSHQGMEKIKKTFLAGAKINGVRERTAVEVFQALEGFAQYGFCKSHALSFAKLTYQSAWLKVYHPAAFLAALLNNQPMGFYPCDTLIEDAKRHGVIVVPTNVNASQLRCHLLDSRTVQLGFNMIKSCGGEAAKVLVQARTQRYASLRDLMQRTNIKRQAMENLIQAGACDSFGLDRRELLWQLWLIQRTG